MPVNIEFLERCQIEYEQNPHSQIFAPLAEGYRRLNMLDTAYDVAERGVRLHPNFAAGRISLARILLEKKQTAEAIEQLKRATTLSPDNLLGFLLLGEAYLKERNPKAALAAFKMALFLNPQQKRAAEMVKKWEFLSASDFDDTAFDWNSEGSPPEASFQAASTTLPSSSEKGPEYEAKHAISIFDALIVRGDVARAEFYLNRAIEQLGDRPDLNQRRQLLRKRQNQEALSRPSAPPTESPSESPTNQRREKLKKLLKKIEARNNSN